MKPRMTDLIKMNVDYGSINNELYFDIEQVRELFPDLRFPPDKIKPVIMGGIGKQGIRQQDMQELTDFDKKVIKMYNFRK